MAPHDMQGGSPMSANAAVISANMAFCRGCGGQIHSQAEMCPKCGFKQASASSSKSKGVAILLCLLLGGIGAHKFYLGQAGLGLLYLVFFWTFIPALIAVFEFFGLLCTSEENFAKRYP
jgi:TM2 domain-containing membrane protein YozV